MLAMETHAGSHRQVGEFPDRGYCQKGVFIKRKSRDDGGTASMVGPAF